MWVLEWPAGLKTSFILIHHSCCYLKKLKGIELMHCSKRSFLGSQLINLRGPYYSNSNKNKYTSSGVFLFFFRLLFKLGYQAKHVWSKWNCIIALQRIYFPIKHSSIDFLTDLYWPLVVLIDFPLVHNQDMLTVWYCLICTVPYLICRVLSCFSFFFCLL